MTHADELILIGGDVVSDPGSELYLEDHLRSCLRCRELRRKVERADRLIAAREPGAVIPPRIARPRTVGRLIVAGVAVGVMLAGIFAGGALRAFRSQEAPSQAGAPAAAPAPVPLEWDSVNLHDLRIPVPRGWEKTIDSIGNSDRPDPASPRILYFEDPLADRAAARWVSIWIWPSDSVERLVRERYVEGNLSLISERTLPATPPMREVIGVADWSDSGQAGRYRARHLFIQVDPSRVVDVVVFGPRTPSIESEPTSEMRAIGEAIATQVTALSQEAGCTRTQATDASGVITDNGTVGIVGDTYASQNDINGKFVIVRRGAISTDRIEVAFHQVGRSAPASRVWYDVGATPGQTEWGDVIFETGVKPIAFANSCWRLVVDGSDSGIVLFIGP